MMTVSPERGTRVAGSVEALKERHGGSVDMSMLHLGNLRGMASEALGDSAAEVWESGRQLDIGEALAEAQEWAAEHGAEPFDGDPITLVHQPAATSD